MDKFNVLKKMGAKIKARREDLNLTQGEVAARAGYATHTSITKIESGLVDLPQSKLALIADILKTTPATLLSMGNNEIKSHIEQAQPEKPYILQLFDSLSEESKKIVIQTMEGFYKLENGTMPDEQELKYIRTNKNW